MSDNRDLKGIVRMQQASTTQAVSGGRKAVLLQRLFEFTTSIVMDGRLPKSFCRMAAI